MSWLRDKLEHVAAMLPLFFAICLVWHLGPFVAAAAITIASFMIEIREGEAQQWFGNQVFGLTALKRAMTRALGKSGKDSLFDWFTPAAIAWMVTIITLILSPAI